MPQVMKDKTFPTESTIRDPRLLTSLDQRRPGILKPPSPVQKDMVVMDILRNALQDHMQFVTDRDSSGFLILNFLI